MGREECLVRRLRRRFLRELVGRGCLGRLGLVLGFLVAGCGSDRNGVEPAPRWRVGDGLGRGRLGIIGCRRCRLLCGVGLGHGCPAVPRSLVDLGGGIGGRWLSVCDRRPDPARELRRGRLLLRGGLDRVDDAKRREERVGARVLGVGLGRRVVGRLGHGLVLGRGGTGSCRLVVAERLRLPRVLVQLEALDRSCDRRLSGEPEDDAESDRPFEIVDAERRRVGDRDENGVVVEEAHRHGPEVTGEGAGEQHLCPLVRRARVEVDVHDRELLRQKAAQRDLGDPAVPQQDLPESLLGRFLLDQSLGELAGRDQVVTQQQRPEQRAA